MSLPPGASQDHVPSSDELRGDRPGWGSGSVPIRIGSLRLTLDGLDDRLAELVRRNYGGFLADGGGPVGAVISTLRAPRAEYLHLTRGKVDGVTEEARVQSRGAGDDLEIWSYSFAGSFDRNAAAGRLLLCEADELDTSQAVENFLRFFVSAAALQGGGFLLHSAGVVRDGWAYLFFGPSGAGKSTAASNSPRAWPRLGDDLVLVEADGQGYRACGVPFRGSFKDVAPNDSGCAPLAMACRLFQSPDVRLEQTSRIVQAAELLGEMPFLMDDRRARAQAAETVERFVRAVPVRRLRLRNDATFWDALPKA